MLKKAIESLKPKELVLLGYIALEGKHGIDRKHLKQLFYPTNTAASLRVAIQSLKAAQTIEIDQVHTLYPSKHLNVDVDELEHYLSHFQLDEASHLYPSHQSSFLYGYEEKYGDAINAWIQLKQFEYAQQLCNVKLYLAEQYISENKTKLAITLAKEAFDIAINLPQERVSEKFMSSIAQRTMILTQHLSSESEAKALKRVIREANLDLASSLDIHQNYLYGDVKYQDAPFGGRQKEIAQALSSMNHSSIKLFQIVGPPLIGKSALAQKIAEEYFNIYQDSARFSRVLFINLEKATHNVLDDLVSFILESLSVDINVKREFAMLFQASQPNSAFHRLLRTLEAGGGILFILDGFEKALDETGATSETLNLFIEAIFKSSQSALLITSRQKYLHSQLNLILIHLNQGLDLKSFESLWERLEFHEPLPFSIHRLWELGYGIPQVAFQLIRLLLQKPALQDQPQLLENEIIKMARHPAQSLFIALDIKEQNTLKIIALCREFITVDLVIPLLNVFHEKLSPIETKGNIREAGS